jgi:hypothetical protein
MKGTLWKPRRKLEFIIRIGFKETFTKFKLAFAFAVYGIIFTNSD